jgi:hypothetical protein
VLEVLQNVDYVLTSKGTHQLSAGGKRAVRGSVTVMSPTSPPNQPRLGSGTSVLVSQMQHALLTDLDLDMLQNVMKRLFGASKNLKDDVFCYFVNALCKLSAEMVEM